MSLDAFDVTCVRSKTNVSHRCSTMNTDYKVIGYFGCQQQITQCLCLFCGLEHEKSIKRKKANNNNEQVTEVYYISPNSPNFTNQSTFG